jgi:hypothetical protein
MSSASSPRLNYRDKIVPTIEAELQKYGKGMMSYADFESLRMKYSAWLDHAHNDPFANLAATMLWSGYARLCKTSELTVLTLALGEEDLNLSLLVNVEKGLRENAKDLPPSVQVPSLIEDIKSALVNYKNQNVKDAKEMVSKEQYATLEKLNEGLLLYYNTEKLKGKTPFLYNEINQKAFQLLASPKRPEEASTATTPNTPTTPTTPVGRSPMWSPRSISFTGSSLRVSIASPSPRLWSAGQTGTSTPKTPPSTPRTPVSRESPKDAAKSGAGQASEQDIKSQPPGKTKGGPG